MLAARMKWPNRLNSPRAGSAIQSWGVGRRHREAAPSGDRMGEQVVCGRARVLPHPQQIDLATHRLGETGIATISFLEDEIGRNSMARIGRSAIALFDID